MPQTQARASWAAAEAARAAAGQRHRTAAVGAPSRAPRWRGIAAAQRVQHGGERWRRGAQGRPCQPRNLERRRWRRWRPCLCGLPSHGARVTNVQGRAAAAAGAWRAERGLLSSLQAVTCSWEHLCVNALCDGRRKPSLMSRHEGSRSGWQPAGLQTVRSLACRSLSLVQTAYRSLRGPWGRPVLLGRLGLCCRSCCCCAARHTPESQADAPPVGRWR